MALGRLKTALIESLRACGLDWVPRHPTKTLLGLTSTPIRTVLDVGANVGQFAEKSRKLFPEAHIFCFEPLPEAFQRLNRWAASQRGKVRVFNVALADYEGHAEMFRHDSHTPSSSLLPSTPLLADLYPETIPQKKIEVEVRTLDEITEVFLPEMTDNVLVKLDVQGFEHRVIKGGPRTLSRAYACLVEVNLKGLYVGQTNMRELADMLDVHGLRYSGNVDQRYDVTGRVIYLNALFSRSQ